MTRQKRVLAIHDISGIGKCSLTVALPIVSAFGIETSVLPTAILSTHTGGFKNFTYRDLTEDLIPIMEHWKTLDIKFDGFYTGYLGSFTQVDIVKNIIEELKSDDSLVIVDPVMADHGVLYSGFSEDFPAKMLELVKISDVITPNMTEACFLLGKKYKEGPYEEKYIEELLYDLGKLGAKKIVLTGVYFDKEKLGAACLDVSNNKVDYYFNNKIEGNYHGSGDVFGSTLTGALMLGKSLLESLKIAVDFTVETVALTKEMNTDPRFGVNFEGCLPKLIRSLSE